MSIVIRDVREHELDSVLALNNNAGLAILPLDAARLRLFYETAEYFRVAERDGNLAGFLIGFGSDSQHDSSNFAWFKQQLDTPFFYIDRIVVASRRRGGGVGRAFYADAQSFAELRYPQMTCEVFLDHGADADSDSRSQPQPLQHRQHVDRHCRYHEALKRECQCQQGEGAPPIVPFKISDLRGICGVGARHGTRRAMDRTRQQQQMERRA